MRVQSGLNLLPLVLLCAGFSAHGQQNTLATGGVASGPGGSVSFSVGQIDYLTVTGSTAVLTEGVQQPYEFFAINVEEEEGIELIASVFPNPARFDVNLLIHAPDYAQMRWTLFDGIGQLVRTDAVRRPQTLLPFADIASGTYLLQVRTKEKIVKSFRIIKHN